MAMSSLAYPHESSAEVNGQSSAASRIAELVASYLTPNPLLQSDAELKFKALQTVQEPDEEMTGPVTRKRAAENALKDKRQFKKR
jgi:hypothetical protein